MRIEGARKTDRRMGVAQTRGRANGKEKRMREARVGSMDMPPGHLFCDTSVVSKP